MDTLCIVETRATIFLFSSPRGKKTTRNSCSAEGGEQGTGQSHGGKEGGIMEATTRAERQASGSKRE